jgi:hypothetical protein
MWIRWRGDLHWNEERSKVIAVCSTKKYEGNFLTDLSKVYEDIKECFPLLERNLHLDSNHLICRVDRGHLVLFELQVQNQDHWDSRALAYAAGFFRNQLKLEGKWEDLK